MSVIHKCFALMNFNISHVLVTKDNQRWVQEDKELLF